jgi:hypothetical protein
MQRAHLKLHSLVSLILAACRFEGGALGFQLSPNQPAQQHPNYYFHHTRKAGGTSMRAWLQSMCGEHNDCGGDREEGCSLSQHRFDDRFGKGSNYVTTVIQLREPVARTESLVKMNLGEMNDTCSDYSDNPEGAPPFCKEITPGNMLRTTHAECYSVPKNTSECCWEGFYIRGGPRDGGIPCPEKHPPLWGCWANQYVKSLVGTDRRDSPETIHLWLHVDETDLELAKRRLAGFNAVLITEWLGHPQVAEYLSKHVFNLSETQPFPHENKGRGFSGTFTREDRDWISSENTYDSKLYEFAREVSLKNMVDAGYSVSMAELDAAR